MTERKSDPPPLVILLRAKHIRERGFTNAKGEKYPPWDLATEHRRRGATGETLPRILLQVVSTEELINAGIWEPDPLPWPL